MWNRQFAWCKIITEVHLLQNMIIGTYCYKIALIMSGASFNYVFVPSKKGESDRNEEELLSEVRGH
jgi:hypothetical protein